MQNKPIHWGYLGLIWALSLQSNCSDRVIEQRQDAREFLVHYAGCRAVLEGPRCVIPESRELTLWVKSETANPSIYVDNNRVVAEAIDLADGNFFSVRLPENAKVLRVEDSSGEERQSFNLFLERSRQMPPLLKKANQLKRSGDYAKALETLEGVIPTLSGRFLANAMGLRARVERALGNSTKAEGYYREAIKLHRTTKNLSGEINDSTALVYVLIQNGRRFAAARDVLKPVMHNVPNHSNSVYLLHYYQGLLARKTEDHRTALWHLERASLEARRMKKPRMRAYSDQVLAHSLAATGRVKEAIALFELGLDESPKEDAGCSRMFLLLNYGWEMLMQFDASLLPQTNKMIQNQGSVFDALTEGLSLVRTTCKGHQEEEVNLVLNLSLAALHENKLGAARNYLEEARLLPLKMTMLQRLWTHDIEGRIAMGEGQYQLAHNQYESMDTVAEAASHPAAKWRAVIGQALALIEMGQPRQAHGLFRHAETLLDTESLLVPIHAGRELFLARHEHATRKYVMSLLNAGMPSEAMLAVRKSRSRYLRSLLTRHRIQGLTEAERLSWDLAMGAYHQEREELKKVGAEMWTLASNELEAAKKKQENLTTRTRSALDSALTLLGTLPAASENEVGLRKPTEDEIFLAFYRGDDGWVGFAQDSETVVAQSLGITGVQNLSSDAFASYFLTPFAGWLATKKRVILFPSGVLGDVDFHALPFGGRPLIESMEVAYSLDLPNHSTASSISHSRRKKFLIVADPRGDLPEARKEGDELNNIMGSRDSIESIRYMVGTEATIDRVRTELASATRFHYAGHGFFQESDNWGAVLPLAADGELTMADILALPTVPDHVMLTGCETARTQTALSMETLGLAQAFILGGAKTIIASSRPIQDALGGDFTRAIYDENKNKNNKNTSAAFYRAQRTILKHHPEADWSSFRLIIP